MAPGRGAEEQQAIQLPMPKAWPLYFPEESYTCTDRRAMLIHQLLPYLATSDGWSLLSRIRSVTGGYSIDVDYEQMRDGSQSGDLVAAVDIQPVEGLACVSAALYEALFVSRQERVTELLGAHAKPGRIKAKLVNFKESTTVIRLLKSSAIGKLVTIKGTVVRASGIKPMITELDFLCLKCGCSTAVRFVDGVYAPPTTCSADGCRGRSFLPQRSTAKAVDWQKLRLQELNSTDKEAAGGVPRTIEVELTEDLVDCCTAGDVVTVLGLVKVISTDTRAGGSNGSEKCLFLLYLEAISVIASRRAQKEEQAVDGSSFSRFQAVSEDRNSLAPPNMETFSFLDLQFIATFTEEFEGEQFRHLTHALCPSIHGHELVKAGLLLALFGGVRKHADSANRVPTRGDIHVLICGDPGLGKSQMLQAAAAVAPRGVYICGNTSTSAGLTASVIRDPLSGGYMCEAGALVLADRGVCCIDEFDKMTSEHQALLGAMEQQEVTTAKAGVCASLPARTAVLAAANPAGGHYTKAKTIAENLKLSTAMLSRFDLIFLLLDRPDEALDERLSEHVLALHAGEDERAHAAKKRLLEYRNAPRPLLTDGRGDGGGGGGGGGRVRLAERLKVYTADDADPVPGPLMRKYIAYARTHVHPVLSPEGKKVLKEFYIELRQKAAATEGAPITTRQLESLVRLAEARARVELRAVATAADAADVVDLMRQTLFDEFVDEAGLLDFRRAGGKSKQAEAKRFLGALARKAELQGKEEFTVSELFDVADLIEVGVPDLSDFIDQLNDAGELLKRGPQRYALRCKMGSATSQLSSRNSGATWLSQTRR